MAQSNQVAQTVGFNTDRYWLWVTGSIAEICKKYNDNELVVKQFGLLFEWLEAQAEGVKAWNTGNSFYKKSNKQKRN